MIRNSRWSLALLACALAFVSLSCASSKELARRSAVALQGGNATKAYELAKKAVDKDPSNGQARAALYEAAQLRAEEWKQKIRGIAEVDSLAAAKEVLDYDDFRLMAARDRAAVEPDSAFNRESRTLKLNAANAYFDMGDQSLDEGRPKRAYDQFQWSARFDPTRKQLDQRLRASLDQATSRVAVMPIENQTGARGFSRRLSDAYYPEIARRIGTNDIHFTQLVSPHDVYTQAQYGSYTRFNPEDAVRVGHKLGVQRVVWTRVFGLSNDTHTDHFHDVVFHKVVDKDSKDRYRVRWMPVDLEVVSRRRDVTVSYEWQILSVADGRTLAAGGDTRTLGAKTVYTNFQAEGDCGDYVLNPPPSAYEEDPDLQSKAGPGRAERVQKEWKAQLPADLELKPLLERARKDRGQRQYQANQLPSFYRGAQPWVFLDDLPPPEDLAFAALVDGWQPICETIRRFDPLDDADIGSLNAAAR